MRDRRRLQRLLVLALCALLTAGCAGSDDKVATETAQQTTTEVAPETTSPDTDTTPPRSYRELMARLPPFDEPASPEVAAWRKATISAFFGRCVSGRGGADKASFVAANRKVLNTAGRLPGGTFVAEYSLGQRDGNGCPEGTGPATYYTTYRTYRLPAGTKPAAVFAHYERTLSGWLESAATPCERTFGQGPAYVVVSACNRVLRLTARARAPVEPAAPTALPPRPFGLQYPMAQDYLATPVPTDHEAEPGESCERISGADVPSIIVPPPPGVSAEIHGKRVVVEWNLGTIYGDCPPTTLVLTLVTIQGSPALSMPFHVGARAGTAALPVPDPFGKPTSLRAAVESVDGTRSRPVAILIRAPS